MSILVSGALIYDHIMDFHGSFKDYILPDNLHILNVAFGVEKLQRGWGGTGGNIAYNMKLLGGDPILISALGRDGADYLERLGSLGIGTRFIVRDSELLSASCYITTDLDNNQITAFYKGPTGRITDLGISDLGLDFRVAIVSPSVREVMLDQMRECRALGIETVFDPGQQMTSFSAEDLRQAIRDSDFIFGNDYEIRLLMSRSGYDKEMLLSGLKALVTTLGKNGSLIETRDNAPITVPACPAKQILDPTGAGDAFRAGFFVGYEKGFDYGICARIGSVAAAYAIEVVGTQEHSFSLSAFGARYEESYGDPFPSL